MNFTELVDASANNTLSTIKVPSREEILRLQNEMAKLPQVEVDTEHYFNGGMYCRKVFRRAGTLIVGKIHKSDHFFMCTSGEIIAWSEKGMITLKAGDVIESKAGTKRVTLAVKDSIGITVHKTDKTDLDEIEAELIEFEEGCMYDSDNKIKQQLISHAAAAPTITIQEV
jgi:mannose-6-phosphate isomerase-like protein (cupin superfamily)